MSKVKRTQRPRKTMAWEMAHEVNRRYIKDRLLASQQPGFDLLEYIHMGRHYHDLPRWITRKQWDILFRYTPGPLGLGMGVKHIVKDMRIGRTTVWRILKQIKTKYPKTMETVNGMRQCMLCHRGLLRSKSTYDGLGSNNLSSVVVEHF